VLEERDSLQYKVLRVKYGEDEGILREVFQKFNPLCGRNLIETDLD